MTMVTIMAVDDADDGDDDVDDDDHADDHGENDDDYGGAGEDDAEHHPAARGVQADEDLQRSDLFDPDAAVFEGLLHLQGGADWGPVLHRAVGDLCDDQADRAGPKRLQGQPFLPQEEDHHARRD